MAIKLRKPEPNEERLSWCKNVDVDVIIDSGKIKGKLDFQFLILRPEELDEEIHGDDPKKVYEFVEKILRSVRGFKDEDGEQWPEDDQLEFTLRANELVSAAYRKYFEYISSGAARKKS